ncbi:IS110 family transposase [Algoriphagus aquimarinus]|uniref:IS110 family transposase n=1 Tax=Algoriphagus aquimarinus TaxID=237018 RepID=UPI0030DD2806|tara:strand:+ start:1711 stop:2712 length:1002 start_codon:yes stop_codon:yes gene_type:complete
MQFESVIGIDVSKLTLDIALVTQDAEVESFKIENKPLAIKKFFQNLSKTLDLESTLICAEHTGHYCYPLQKTCLEEGYSLWIEGGAEIKQRSGVTRYKNDKVDAIRIADYAKRYQDKAKIQKTEDYTIESVRSLSSERELFTKERAKYKTQVKDLKGFMDEVLFKARGKRLKKQIDSLTKLIQEIDKQIKVLMQSNKELANQKKLLISIDGIGEQTAIHTIVATGGFTKFNSGRKFGCHVGVAPFSFESGSSQRSRKKVSSRANKDLKTLFHMCALSAIRMKGELKEYFERKVGEGKNKMTVINAVRSKLINRIFAVIRDNRKYEKNYTVTLA